MSATNGYSAADYDAMFMDEGRRTAYYEAIARVIRPGDVVVEVGTGFGYFAVEAVRAGARHVYAIERDPAIAVAEELVRENGLADRITCIHGDARQVSLPERGSVLLSDLRGLTPLSAMGIPTLVSVRRRLVAPDARHISLRDTMFAAPCEAPRRWRGRELAIGAHFRGGTRHAVERVARSDLHRDYVEPSELLGGAAVVAEIDYRTVESPDVAARLEWTVSRAGVAEGITLWFVAEITEGVSFTTAPGGPKDVYGNGFLPFERAVPVAAGDRITCEFRATLVGPVYVYAWDTTVTPGTPGAGEPIRMRQSSLPALMLAPDLLERRRRDHQPQPADFAVVSAVLALADGRRTLAEIGAELLARCPDRFGTEAEAADWATATLANLAQLSGSG